MAVSGVGRSNSIYGTRNVITGLASGMDTESMIENAISGYKSKISALSQKRTKVEWQQEAYRSIITKMAAFTNKYADYRSSTNLMSPSFFNQSVKTVSQGANASKVSASGKTNSDIQINAVKQLARAATYRVSGSAMNSAMDVNKDGTVSITADKSFNLDGEQTVSTVEGSISLVYGGSDARSYLELSFGELDNFKDAQAMAENINKQLSEQSITTSSGNSKKASEMLRAKVENGNIVFEDATGAGNQFYISSASGKIKDTLGVKTGQDAKSLEVGGKALTEDVKTSEYLTSGTMSITLDGQTKSIKMPTAQEILDKVDWSKVNGGKDGSTGQALARKILNGESITGAANRQIRDDAYVAALQEKIDGKFGTVDKIDADGNVVKNADGKAVQVSKLQVSDALKDKMNLGTEGAVTGIQLKFTTGQKGSSFSVSGSKAEAMGLSKAASSYLDTSKKLKDIVDLNDPSIKYTEKDGVKLYSFELNGQKIGEFTEDTDLSTIMSRINGNKEAGVKVSYSKTTNEFTFTATESGSAGEIEFGDGLAKALFGDSKAEGANFTAGQDAIFTATINGTVMESISRSSNTVDLDGLTVNLKGEFGYNGDVRDKTAEAVTFSSSADADKIVDAIKSMVEDYNAMATEIKNAYSTLPNQKSNGQYYEPLTDEDMEEMSDSAIEHWNEKAKAGILFGDNDLRSLYQRITKAVSMTGADGADLKAAGITVSYANGLTTLSFNETQLRATLETDPDRVTDIFTKNTDSGSSTKGFLQALKEPLDLYGKTEGVNLNTGTKGVLVTKAGHPLAASSLYTNTIQKQLDKIDQEIASWQDKMSDRVDYYTNKFSQLEQLIMQMNSQSSSIAGLLGNG